jgi:uncharacterized protein (TIGR02145 family)
VNEILQEVLVHYEGVGVPGTGSISSGDSVLPTLAIALGMMLAVALVCVLACRKKSARRILVPVVAVAFGLSGVIATAVNAASAFVYTDTVELSLVSPATDVSASVDLSGLYTTYGGAPTTITVQNISNANMTVDTTLNGAAKTLAVDVTIPNGSVSGDYTAEIVYAYPATPTYMQDLTASQCAALTTWDGANGEILVLKDKRDEKEYNVAKLADGKCWMLNNLRLGSESATMALTSTTSNISSNWTLPQVVTTSNYDYDIAHVYGPVTGDTGTGATDYGYLYNWCAATAGGTASGGANTCTAGGTMPADSTGDVCPANWRLPKGGNYDQTGNEFSNLVATLAGYPSNTDAGFTGAFDWGSTFVAGIQPTGAFRGNYSGSWYGSFYDQGDYGYWWSGSAYPSYSYSAFGLVVNTWGYVDPVDADDRDFGFAVRCLLN